MDSKIQVRYEAGEERVAILSIPAGTILSINGGVVQIQEATSLRVTFPEYFEGQDILKTDLHKVLRGPE